MVVLCETRRVYRNKERLLSVLFTALAACGSDPISDVGADAAIVDMLVDITADATEVGDTHIDASDFGEDLGADVPDANQPDASMSGLCNPDPDRLKALTGRRPGLPEPPSGGMVHQVSTVEEFANLVRTGGPLSPGDTIEFQPGQYDLGGIILRGDAAGVLIKPANGLHAAEITNTTVLLSAAPDVVWWGFLYTGVGPFISLRGDGGPLRADRNEFYDFRFQDSGGVGNIILFDVRTNDVEIHDNEFIRCGNRLWNGTVSQPPGQSPTPERMHVHHNSIVGIKDGTSPKLMGMGGGVWQDWNGQNNGWSTKAVIEYNYIEGWLGNAEIGGFKASDNVFQYNYITGSGATGGRLNVRAGHNNRFFGNYIDDVKIGFGVQGTNNIFQYNFVSGDGAATGVALSMDSGDENVVSVGRNGSSDDTTVTCNLFTNGFLWTHCATTGGKRPINGLPMGNAIADNWWIGDRTPTYTDCATPVTEAELGAVNNFENASAEVHPSIDACPMRRYTCDNVAPPSWW